MLRPRLVRLIGLAVISMALAGASDVRAQQRELHAISLQQTYNDPVPIEVDRPGQHVTLVLSGAKSVTWDVSATPGTVIESVILGGNERQSIQGLAVGVDVQRFDTTNPTSRYLYVGSEIDTPEFRDTIRFLHQITGIHMSSLQASRPNNNFPFVVNQSQDNPLFDLTYPPPVHYSELPDLRFEAVYYPPVPTDYPQDNLSYGDFSLAGPDLRSLLPLPKGIIPQAHDRLSETFYALDRDGVIEVSSGVATEHTVPNEIQGNASLSGIAFDDQRDRLLISGTRRSSILFQFDLATEQWSVLSQLPDDKRNYNVMAYDTENDLLYAVADGRGYFPEFQTYDATGALIDSVDLGLPPLLGFGTQLFSADDHLVLLTRPFWGTPAQTYLITPGTGHIVQVVPEPSTLLLVIIGAGMLACYRLRSWRHLLGLMAVAITFGVHSEAKAQQELHAVAIHDNSENPVKIEVDRPGKQVTLFLTSDYPHGWDVATTPGTEIKTVIFGGRGSQTVLDLPLGDIDIQRYDGFPLRFDRIDFDHDLDTKISRDSVRKLHDITGMHLTSLQNESRQENRLPVVVGDVQNDPLLRLTYPRPVHHSELPDLRFEAIYYPPNPPNDDTPYTPMYGQFSLAGPNLQSLAPVPNGITLIGKDESRGTYYGAHGEGKDFFVVDFIAGTTEKISVSEPAIDILHPGGITYDDLRDRLIYGGSHGSGEMYQFDLVAEQWSILSDLPKISHAAIAYHSENDLLYFIDHHARSLTDFHVLRVLNANGALVEIMELGMPLRNSFVGINDQGLTTYTQLISVDDYLVLMTPDFPGEPGKTYLISPDTGNVVRVVPEPSTALLAITGLGMVACFRLRRRII